MIRQITSLLGRIVGRIRKHMYTAGLAFSLMLVPLGYYLVVEGQNSQMQLGGVFSVIAGITLFLIAWIKVLQEENATKKDNKEKYIQLIDEIKGLRKDIVRLAKNERNKPK